MNSLDKLQKIRHDFYNNDELEYDSFDYFTAIKRDLELLEILCNHLSAFLGTGEYDSKTQKIILLRGNILENDKDFEELKARLKVQEGEIK